MTLKVEGDAKTWPEYIYARKDGSLFVQQLSKRKRVFTYLYRDMLLRYDLVLAVSRDSFQRIQDFQAWRWAVKTLPVPVAEDADAEALASVERYYAESSSRAMDRKRMEKAQAKRRYMGHDTPQPSLPGEAFPPPHVFYPGEPLSPVVHTLIKPVFLAVSRHPMFHSLSALPHLVDRFPQGQVVLVGIPRYEAATLAAFLRTLKQFETKPARELKPNTPSGKVDPTLATGAISKSKRVELFGGIFKGRYLTSEAVHQLATMPTLETVQGQLVGTIANLAGRQLVGTLARVGSAGQQIVGLLARAGGQDVLSTLEGRRKALEDEEKKCVAHRWRLTSAQFAHR